MKRNAILFCLLTAAAAPLLSQSDHDVADCLRACLQAPELETAFTQEWGALRPLYLRKRGVPGSNNRPTDEQVNRLTAEDFQGLPWMVVPVTQEEIYQLPRDEVEFAIFEAGIGFREGHATVNLFINLPRYPRKWMTASFLLEKEGEKWAVQEKTIEFRP